MRVNRVRTVKPSQTVRPGDVLTIALRGQVQVLKVLAPGTAGGRRRRRACSTRCCGAQLGRRHARPDNGAGQRAQPSATGA